MVLLLRLRRHAQRDRREPVVDIALLRLLLPWLEHGYGLHVLLLGVGGGLGLRLVGQARLPVLLLLVGVAAGGRHGDAGVVADPGKHKNRFKIKK